MYMVDFLGDQREGRKGKERIVKGEENGSTLNMYI
jgi:hypothetical protein